MARRDGTRNGIDWSSCRPWARSCLIDGEAIAYDGDGLASFELLRGRRHDRQMALCAFDLLELDGRDLRLGTFRLACERWPGIPITLRRGERSSRTAGIAAGIAGPGRSGGW